MNDTERERIVREAVDGENIEFDPKGWAGEATGSSYSRRFFEALVHRALSMAVPADSVVVKREHLEKIRRAGSCRRLWGTCPSCDASASQNHAPDCWLATALGGAS